jgi:hypothetical protein
MFSVLTRRRLGFGLGLTAVVLVATLYLAPHRAGRLEGIPEQFSDAEFWNILTGFSEPGGYFRSDNFVSNESAFQRVIPELKKRVPQGGVYLGVGPDQNFTYIAALQPKVAFIIDIRRQNMLLHLMYKALFELAEDRKDFLSKLFARRTPETLSNEFTAEELFDAFHRTESDSKLATHNLEAILRRLRDHHRFDLSLQDSRDIQFVYNSFVSAGPEIRYSFPNQYAWRRFPSYLELMLETDGVPGSGGTQQSYMASEENFQRIRRMELENRIIPIVGDFAGAKALRSVSDFLKERGATVSTFYTSNVEFYLFQTEDWKRFFDTVADLPINEDSVFIRSYFNNSGLPFPRPPVWLQSPPQSYSLLDGMASFQRAYAGGRIEEYADVVRRSQP